MRQRPRFPGPHAYDLVCHRPPRYSSRRGPAISTATVTAPAVELTGITKRFPGVVANRDIQLRVTKGQIHAIVGENGAGKSTLMKILYGMQRPDEGEIRVEGKPVAFHTPADAIAAGIGMVHQHFMLADNLTVLENVILGSEPRRAGVAVDFRAARRKIKEISDAYGLGIRPDVPVEELGVGDRQRVEILKVLYRGARILILDEPTAVLVPHEVDELFENLRGLVREGLTILFISHKLDEVLRVADAITVIRRGTTVASVDPKDMTARRLAELMVGSELPSPETRESTVTDTVVLSVRDLTVGGVDGRAIVEGVGFDIHKGEVLGIAGVEGNGQAELVEALMGIRPCTTGSLMLDGKDISGWSTLKRREGGIGYIPEDRHRHGLLLEAPLWENRILGHQTRRPNVKGPWIDRSGARADTRRIAEDYDVRTPGIDTAAAALSGGNQQKLIVGREMSGDPVLLIASHPTRGVDVGAQAAIWDHLRNARANGLAVLLISADLDELIGLSDSLKVILRGRIVADVDPANVTPEQLGSAMTGAGEAAAQ
ncbi:sugar ABC transporter ATP-binding protein [Sphaerimonospora thailandensis]|uniref:Sugar ABC transporter ATP-binding protein n=1 Tax=Sphaerimonospora thailandensis TaxID=795644 RepID=A0A8J3R7B6_9ACTN|nr:sugar ABC transporter ATP-binding protein [Sphaerimonospora thailandensis]